LNAPGLEPPGGLQGIFSQGCFMTFSTVIEAFRVLAYASLLLFCFVICLKRRRFAARTARIGMSFGLFLVFFEIAYAACLLSSEPNVSLDGIKQVFTYDVYVIFAVVKIPLIFAGCLVFSAAGLYFSRRFPTVHPPSGFPAPRRAAFFSRRVLRDTRSWMPVVLLVVFFMLAYTWVLFVLCRPRPHQTFNEEFLAVLFGGRFKTLALASYSITAAVWEEIVFRMAAFGGLLWVLTRRTGAGLLTCRSPVVLVCAALSSLLWTFGHMGMLTPEWVKLAQVLPMGVIFALLYFKFGIVASVTAHVLFNLGVVFIVGPRLF
jgi:hypothetical protein